MSHKASGSKSRAVAASQEHPPPTAAPEGGGGRVGLQLRQEERRGLCGSLPLTGAPGTPPDGMRSAHWVG